MVRRYELGGGCPSRLATGFGVGLAIRRCRIDARDARPWGAPVTMISTGARPDEGVSEALSAVRPGSIAVMCASDYRRLAVMRAAKAGGLDVPGDDGAAGSGAAGCSSSRDGCAWDPLGGTRLLGRSWGSRWRSRPRVRMGRTWRSRSEPRGAGCCTGYGLVHVCAETIVHSVMSLERAANAGEAVPAKRGRVGIGGWDRVAGRPGRSVADGSTVNVRPRASLSSNRPTNDPVPLAKLGWRFNARL